MYECIKLLILGIHLLIVLILAKKEELFYYFIYFGRYEQNIIKN